MDLWSIEALSAIVYRLSFSLMKTCGHSCVHVVLSGAGNLPRSLRHMLHSLGEHEQRLLYCG